MFRDLRVQVSSARRILAVGLLLLALMAAGWLAYTRGAPSFLLRNTDFLLGTVGLFLGIRLFTYFLLDPILSDPRTAIPGSATEASLRMAGIASGFSCKCALILAR